MYKNINKNIFSLLITLLLILNISYISSKQIKIYLGDSFNQDLKTALETRSKLFLIFFAKNCEYCGYAVRVLKEKVVVHYENDNKITFGVVNLDRKDNFWIGLKFNITQIPYIVLIEEKKMYLFNEQFEEMNVVNFINEEKNIEDALDIPDDVSLMKKINFYMADIIQKTSDIFYKRGFSKFWSNIGALILLILAFLYLIYLEHKILSSVRTLVDYCKKSKKKKNSEEIKGNKEEKNDKENKDDKDDTNKEKKE